MRLLDVNRWSLSVKMPMVIILIVAGVGLSIGFVIIVQDWLRARAALEDKALLITRTIAVKAPDAILRNDYWALYKSIRQVYSRDFSGLRDTKVLQAMALDPQGFVLAHSNPETHPLGEKLKTENDREKAILEKASAMATSGIIHDDKFIESVIPIYSDKKKIGLVRVRLSTDELYTQALDRAVVVFGVTMSLILLGSLIGIFISRRLIGPLTVLTQGMEKVGRGDFSSLPSGVVTRGDEIGRLGTAFRKMTVELEEKKKLEKELAVNDKLIALGRIAAGVAHEVNNPLTGILNCLDTLKKHPGDRALLARYLPLIEKGLNRIRLIVTGLLGELRAEETLDCSDTSCLDDLHELALTEIGDRQINLEWITDIQGEIRLNRHRVQQVILNLLKNAFHATQEGGKVIFRAWTEGGRLVLEVEDDGTGIAEEDLGKLFDPFFSTRPDGTGLGLWITYRLVRGMSGDIEVNSETGGGALFRVVIPVRNEEEILREAS